MSPDNDLSNTIRSLVLERLSIDIPPDDVDLIETGVLDSLILVDLILNLEQKFSISIPLESVDLDNFRTVGAIAALVARLCAIRVATSKARDRKG